jgi:hypothetical protein
MRKVPMKRFTVDQVSASLTCLCKKCPMEMHGRSQENGLRFETLGRNVMLTWSRLIFKTPVAIAVTAVVEFSFAQPASRQSDWNPTSTRCIGSFGAKRGIKLGNGRNVYG